MAKSSEKSFQSIQPRWQIVFRSLQVSLLPRALSTLVSFPLRILPAWADIQKVARRHWLRRLPAVIAAAILLFFFMNLFGIGQEELLLASFVSLSGLACFIIMGNTRQI